MFNNNSDPVTCQSGIRKNAAVVEQLSDLTIDLDWLDGYDHDMINSLQAYALYRAFQYNRTHAGGLFVSGKDLFVANTSVAKTLADALTECQGDGRSDDNLIDCLVHLVAQGYLTGVRDTYESCLSDGAQISIAEEVDRRGEFVPEEETGVDEEGRLFGGTSAVESTRRTGWSGCRCELR